MRLKDVQAVRSSSQRIVHRLIYRLIMCELLALRCLGATSVGAPAAHCHLHVLLPRQSIAPSNKALRPAVLPEDSCGRLMLVACGKQEDLAAAALALNEAEAAVLQEHVLRQTQHCGTKEQNQPIHGSPPARPVCAVVGSASSCP